MNRRTPFALILALFAIGRAVAAEPWPEIPSPPHADVQWVAESMRINGVPTRVLQFQSTVTRTEVVEYYKAFWSRGYPTKPSVRPLGAAIVISQRHGPYFMTVKVEDTDSRTSHGLVSVALVVGTKVTLDAGDLPIMPGAHVVSVVESDDPGKHSREVLLVLPQPRTSVTQFYSASFTNAGWQQIQAGEDMRSPGGSSGSFVVFAKDHDEMQLSFVSTPKGRGSALVANLVTKDTGPGGR
jgi:hypothetical protein